MLFFLTKYYSKKIINNHTIVASHVIYFKLKIKYTHFKIKDLHEKRKNKQRPKSCY